MFDIDFFENSLKRDIFEKYLIKMRDKIMSSSAKLFV